RAGRETEMRHQHEERQRAELVAGHRLEHEDAGFDQRGLEPERHDQTAEPGYAERDADRHPADQQEQQHDDADETDARLTDHFGLRRVSARSDSPSRTPSV